VCRGTRSAGSRPLQPGCPCPQLTHHCSPPHHGGVALVRRIRDRPPCRKAAVPGAWHLPRCGESGSCSRTLSEAGAAVNLSEFLRYAPISSGINGAETPRVGREFAATSGGCTPSIHSPAVTGTSLGALTASELRRDPPRPAPLPTPPPPYPGPWSRGARALRWAADARRSFAVQRPTRSSADRSSSGTRPTRAAPMTPRCPACAAVSSLSPAAAGPLYTPVTHEVPRAAGGPPRFPCPAREGPWLREGSVPGSCGAQVAGAC
jgi:hypothetical protein